ncbi:uncharacterized protein LOC110865496 [Helianthus annuus]|uniref:uncharacterized protein LOC110865496 n=1 Tax=Helianthus annuus TaxID=4232 RepID=UPI000B9093BF|nr:uncharacterized protein LOC110865496 [Helianthus annuus]
MGKEKDYRKEYSISSKWTDINSKCHQFQEVFQRNWDNMESGQNDANVITRALEEYNATKDTFTYLRCWELLRGSPKWANVPTITSSVRRKSKRSKTSSSVDPDTPTSDARNVNLNIIVDNEEDLELEQPPGRRSAKNKRKKAESSSSNHEILKQDFEEMNRRLQDIRDLGDRRLQTIEERNLENKKFVAIQESRQIEKDIKFLSKPIDHLTGDALILAQMRREQIRRKYGL